MTPLNSIGFGFIVVWVGTAHAIPPIAVGSETKGLDFFTTDLLLSKNLNSKNTLDRWIWIQRSVWAGLHSAVPVQTVPKLRWIQIPILPLLGSIILGVAIRVHVLDSCRVGDY